ncbi:hypothetical protein GCM10009116_16530 [Brevundimonas basaltis]
MSPVTFKPLIYRDRSDSGDREISLWAALKAKPGRELTIEAIYLAEVHYVDGTFVWEKRDRLTAAAVRVPPSGELEWQLLSRNQQSRQLSPTLGDKYGGASGWVRVDVAVAGRGFSAHHSYHVMLGDLPAPITALPVAPPTADKADIAADQVREATLSVKSA